MKKAKKTKQAYGHGYSHISRKRRTKSDWAGVSIGDGFKNNVDYFHRISAQRIFYNLVKENQKKVCQLVADQAESDFEAKAKPQISPLYTTYPSNLTGHVAIGLTTFLEYKAHVEQKSLFTYLNKYLENPAEYDDLGVDPEIYKTVARIVTEHVQTRLLLEDLSRFSGMSSVELYRLFSASQQQFSFSSLPEIIRAVVLYGDVLPDWQGLNLHPMTRSVLSVLTRTSRPYFAKLVPGNGVNLSNIGVDWVRAICHRLSSFLPPPAGAEKDARLNMDPAFEEAMAEYRK